MEEDAKLWLARIIKRWQPDIVHTLGLDPAGEFYFSAGRLEETIAYSRRAIDPDPGYATAMTTLGSPMSMIFSPAIKPTMPNSPTKARRH